MKAVQDYLHGNESYRDIGKGIGTDHKFIPPAASPSIDTNSPVSKPKKTKFHAVINALGKMPNIATIIFMTKLTCTVSIGLLENQTSKNITHCYLLPAHL